VPSVNIWLARKTAALLTMCAFLAESQALVGMANSFEGLVQLTLQADLAFATSWLLAMNQVVMLLLGGFLLLILAIRILIRKFYKHLK
jgi:ABC-type multidrug transport system fused ATPase/permease subunit